MNEWSKEIEIWRVSLFLSIQSDILGSSAVLKEDKRRGANNNYLIFKR